MSGEGPRPEGDVGRRSRRLHRLLRAVLLPGWFRTRHGAAMGEAFGRRLERSRVRGGSLGVGLAWVREVADLAGAGVRLRLRGDRSGPGARTIAGREGTMGLRGAWDDAVLAFRGLARAPRFTLFAAGTLALGIGASTAVFGALESVVLNPLPFPDSDRIVTVWRSAPGGQGLLVPRSEQVAVWAGMDDVFEELRVYGSGSSVLTGRGDPLRLSHYRAGPGLLEMLGAEMVLGRGFTEDERAGDGAPVVLLAESLWTRRFGRDPGVLGTAVSLDGEPWTVVGVLSDVVNPTSGVTTIDVWSPHGRGADARTVSAIGLLREGVTPAEADVRLDAFADGADGAGLGDPGDWRARALLLGEFGRAGIAATLRLLMGAVTLLLVIACVNVANLLLHRTLRSRRETAVRAALGAGRLRLLRHSILGSLMLGVAGAAGGVVVAWAALRLIEAIRPDRLRLLDGVALDPGVLGLTLGVALAAGILFGAFPALQVARGRWAEGLPRGSARGTLSGEGKRLRWALVTGEVALSFALLVGATVVLGSLREMQARDPGFRTEGLLAVSVDLPSWRYGEEALRAGTFERIRARVQGLPEVRDVGITTGIPPEMGFLFGRIQAEGRPPEDESTFVQAAFFSPGVASLLEQPLLAGRDLEPGDEDVGAGSVVVSRALAERLFAGAAPADALGRRFRTSEDGDFHTVVGVVEQIRTTLGTTSRPELLVYFPLETYYGSMELGVRLEPGAVAPGEEALRRLVRSVEPDAFVDAEPVSALMAETVARERFTATLLTGFAALAALLCAVGLYGVLAEAVGERTREIGIRMSLGADAGRVRGMVLRGGAAATAAGLVAGSGLALLGRRLAGSEVGGFTGLVEVTWLSWLTAGLLLAAVALVAMWVPARRATHIPPAEALRAD